MVDFTDKIIEIIEAKTGLSCYAEQFIDNSASIPCTSIMMSSNPAREEGDNIRYSYPMYQIKVYCDVIADAYEYMDKIDVALFKFGLKRHELTPLTVGTHFQLISRYGQLAFETIN